MPQWQYVPQQEAKGDADPLVTSLVEFLSSKEVSASFQGWLDDHCEAFASRKSDEQEQQLAWYQTHSDYKAFVDQQLDRFLTEQKVDAAELMQRCKAATDGPSMRFVFMFIATTDYSYFAGVMQQRYKNTYGTDAKAEAKAEAALWVPPASWGGSGGQSKAESK